MIEVLLLDQDARFAQALGLMLNQEPDLRVVATATTTLDALEAAEALRPDVVLFDLDLPAPDGIAALQRLAALPSEPRVLALSRTPRPLAVLEAVRAGARGCLPKTLPVTVISQAVRTIAGGGAVLDSTVLTALLEDYRRFLALTFLPGHPPALTAHESQLLRLLGEGNRNRELARALGRAESTIKNSLTLLYEKLGVKNRTQAAALALRLPAAPVQREIPALAARPEDAGSGASR